MPKLSHNAEALRHWHNKYSALQYAETIFQNENIPYNKKKFKAKENEAKKYIKIFNKSKVRSVS